ncbi:MAG: glycogen-binding domain-containing protein [Victivallaceae bacterium]
MNKTQAGKKKVVFSIEFDDNLEHQVFVAGSFNDWDSEAKPLTRKVGSNTYSTTLMLRAGVYEYKFVVDGVWCVDAGNSEFTPNDMGTLNSVIKID